MNKARDFLQKGTAAQQRTAALLVAEWDVWLAAIEARIARKDAKKAAAQAGAPADAKAEAAKAARVRLGDLLLEEALRPAPGRARDLAAQIEEAIFISGATAAEVAALRASAERASTDDELSGPDPRDPVMDALVEMYLRQGGVHVSAGAAAV